MTEAATVCEAACNRMYGPRLLGQEAAVLAQGGGGGAQRGGGGRGRKVGLRGTQVSE